jgi:hypothetical protein
MKSMYQAFLSSLVISLQGNPVRAFSPASSNSGLGSLRIPGLALAKKSKSRFLDGIRSISNSPEEEKSFLSISDYGIPDEGILVSSSSSPQRSYLFAAMDEAGRSVVFTLRAAATRAPVQMCKFCTSFRFFLLLAKRMAEYRDAGIASQPTTYLPTRRPRTPWRLSSHLFSAMLGLPSPMRPRACLLTART